jgi:hypothetical protein
MYTPFLSPLPLYDVWYLLLPPLCLGVAVAYKATKCGSPRDLPLESARLFAYILGALLGIAAALLIVVDLV